MFDDVGGALQPAGDACGEVEAAVPAEWVPLDPEDPWSDDWLADLAGDVFDSCESVAVASAPPAGSRSGFEPVDAVTALVGSDLARCSASGLVDIVVAAQGLIGWAQAVQAEALAALTRCAEMRPDVSPATARHGFGSLSAVTITAAEVAQVLSLTTRQAENLVGEAVRLVEDFPLTHAALSAGRLDARRVKVVVDELGTQEPRCDARWRRP